MLTDTMTDEVVSRPSRYERLLVGLILVSLLVIPWPFAATPDLAKSAMGVWFLGIGLLWSFYLMRSQVRIFVGQGLAKMAWLSIGLLLLTQAWVALQLNWTQSVYHTFLYLELGLVYTLVYAMVLSLFYTRKRLIALVAVIVIGGTFQAFYGSMMVLSRIEMIWWYEKIYYLGNATGTFINRNHLAGYLEMAMALGIGLMLAFRTGEAWSWRNFLTLLLSSKFLIRLALIVMVIGLVMTHSRMGNAAFMISLIVAGLLFVVITPAKRTRNLLILASIVVIDILIISQFFGLERLKDRIEQTEVTISTDGDGSLVLDVNDLRSLGFKRSLPLALESPFLGQGAGTYEIAFMSYAGLDFGGHHDHAHQDYLQFWIEFGAIGSVLLLFFVAIAFWHAIKAIYTRRSVFRSGMGLGVLMAILSIGIHSLSDFNLQIPANALTFVVVCAIALLTVYHRRVHRKMMVEEAD